MMGAMYRITCKKLLILIRLVIVVSLAGYSLSTATAAMHGGALNGTTVVSDTMEHADAQSANTITTLVFLRTTQSRKSESKTVATTFA